MSNTPPLAPTVLVLVTKSLLDWNPLCGEPALLDTDAGADGGVDVEKPYVASIALLIPGGDGRSVAPDTDIGEVDPKDATAGWDAGDD
jgi:hypothetical protein